jgi:hypothetical protein
LITGIIGFRNSVSGPSVFADILADLVILGLAGVDNTFGEVFPASGDDGNVDILLLVLRPTVVSSSCTSFLTPRFLAVTLPPLGVNFRRDRVIFTMVCGSSSTSSFSSGSDLREVRRVLRRCGLIVDRDDLMRLAILRGEPPVGTIGVELVTSLKGDFSSGRDGVESSILLPIPFPVVVLMDCVELSIRGRDVVELMRGALFTL